MSGDEDRKSPRPERAPTADTLQRPASPLRRRPLTVHVVLHDDADAEGRAVRGFVSSLYARLARGDRPASIALRVWVGAKSGPPELPSFNESDRNVVILLVDQRFFEARAVWDDYVAMLGGAVRLAGRLLLPISICGNAHRVSAALADVNHVLVADPAALATDETVFQAILTAILRVLPEPSADVGGPSDRASILPRIFLCHGKSDGEDIARRLRRHVYEHSQLSCFFDRNDIPHGSDVKASIRAAIAESCIVVVWTSRLLESRWCQFEILEARLKQRPLVVLDALDERSARVFPFLGNMPVSRWGDDPGRILSAVLFELVRTRHLAALFESLRREASDGDLRFVLHPPDIMDAAALLSPGGSDAPSVRRLAVHPDPPIQAEEADFLRNAFTDVDLCSLSEWTAWRAAGLLTKRDGRTPERSTPLAGMVVALSVSSAEDWAQCGLVADHQDDYAVDIGRQLVLLGAKLAWGGDLRVGGLGQRLKRVVKDHHRSDHAPQDHIASYLAWPLARAITPAKLQAVRSYADVVCLPSPIQDDGELPAFEAVCFSLMRDKMASDCRARIVLGGKLNGYRGRYPGVAEEALATIGASRALYIVGGLGGASRAVYDAIALPEKPNPLAGAWLERTANAATLATNEAYDALAASIGSDLRVDHAAMMSVFAAYGIEGLCACNGLDAAENGRLASSGDIHEIIGLLVKGLASLRVTPAS